MIQPTRVLPSNAPPLQDGSDNVHHASRVLQDHSGNRQQNDFGFATSYKPKYQVPALTENNYPRQPQHQPALPLYQPQPQHRQGWRFGYARAGYRYYAPEDEAKIEAKVQIESERLYRRFRQCDQYNKYRNRQSKDDKGNGDQKWPEHLEKAFFYALVKYQPMGRRKQLHKDKQRGRNELIADCIEELTGVERSRKQVSSHIQVLKPFVENDPQIMRWLSKEDMRDQAQRYHGMSAGAFGNGRRMSNYPVTAPSQAMRAAMPSLPRTDLLVLQKFKGSLDLFSPTDFQMFVQRKYKVSEDHEEVVQRLHTYTQVVSNPLGPDLPMPDWETVNQEYPLLAEMHAQQPLDCNIIAAEASLAFPPDTWKDKDGSPLPGVELGISFLCSSRHLPPSANGVSSQVRCVNSFYENKVYIKEQNGQPVSGQTDVHLAPSDRGSSVGAQIKFGSTFWASKLGRLAVRLLDTSKDHREDVAAYISGLNAVQEVFVLTEHGPERILVIHWKFCQPTGVRGKTSWRRLLLPSQVSQFSEPAKSERVDSFCYDTPFPDTSGAQSQPQQSQPTLQSPFEYDSASGSALSSATWPTYSSEGSMPAHCNNNIDYTTENSFDFNAGSISLAYDPNLNFDNFDSPAFNFDTSTADFAADPNLQEYSTGWCDTYTTAFDGQPTVAENPATFSEHPDFGTHTQMYDDYGGQYDQQAFARSNDQQAYGGAGQEMLRDDDALAALADASYMASALSTKQEPM